MYEVDVASQMDAASQTDLHELHRGSGGSSTVALKVLRPELAASARERDRFLLEAERMQRVSHPALVQLLEAGLLPDGRPYLAMPLLDGETLASRVAHRPLPLATALQFFDAIARGVHALHAAGLVHRDIKPENVIIVDDGARAVLLDFGIAREVDGGETTTTTEGRVRGTPAYMAPERFFGAAATVSSDVYELAVLLYVMLTGALPWSVESSAAERLDPSDPRRARPDIPGAIATTVLRALSTRPEVRPVSAEAFADAMVRASRTTDDMTSEARRTEDLEVSVASATGARPVSDAKERRRRSYALPFGGAALLAVAGALVWSRGDVSRKAASDATAVLEADGTSAPASTSSDHAAIATSVQAEDAPSSENIVVGASNPRSAPPPAPARPARSSASPVERSTPSSLPTASTRRREDWFEDRR